MQKFLPITKVNLILKIYIINLIEVGDVVEVDEAIAEVATDKVNVGKIK